MSTSLWHEGALFPIFEAETVAHSKLQMRDQVREGLRKVTRSVRLFQIYDTSLPATLEKADEIFDHLAEASDGQVVEHTWGLYPSQERNSLYDALDVSPHLPAGYTLAVQTATLPDLRPTSMREYLLAYEAVSRHRDGPEWPKWWDASAHHFEANSQGVHLLDIEPLLETDPAGAEYCYLNYRKAARI